MSVTKFPDVRRTIMEWLLEIKKRGYYTSFGLFGFDIVEPPMPSMMSATNESMTEGFIQYDYSPFIKLHIGYKGDRFKVLWRFKDEIESFIIAIYETILKRNGL